MSESDMPSQFKLAQLAASLAREDEQHDIENLRTAVNAVPQILPIAIEGEEA